MFGLVSPVTPITLHPAAYELMLVTANATAAAILTQLFLVLPRTSSEQATHVCVASLHLDL